MPLTLTKLTFNDDLFYKYEVHTKMVYIKHFLQGIILEIKENQKKQGEIMTKTFLKIKKISKVINR